VAVLAVFGRSRDESLCGAQERKEEKSGRLKDQFWKKGYFNLLTERSVPAISKLQGHLLEKRALREREREREANDLKTAKMK
jgi:hypothetical protein